MRLGYTLTVVIFLTVPALAQTPGDCAPGTAQAELDISDVRATLSNVGNLLNDVGAQDAYTVPQETGISPLYYSTLWIAGTVGGEARVSATGFGGGGTLTAFWPGPLLDGGLLPDSDDCSVYDRIYVVSVLDVEQYETTGTATPDLAEWPVGLGAPAVDAAGVTIVSDDLERVLDLAAGERPALSGSQMAFWVVNDVGNENEYFGSPPLGIEVATTAFATVSEDDALDQATVYRYAVTNRGTQPIADLVVGFNADPNLGDAGDDVMGADTTRSLVFVYNATETDGQYGVPPAFGFDLLSGGLGSSRGVKGSGPTDGPQTTVQAYRALRGLWNDGVPITEGGSGYMTNGEVTLYQFPGDPVAGAFWSEENVDGNGTQGQGAERIHLFASTAETLTPGETRVVDLALVFAQGVNRLDSITELRAASDRIQAAYDDGSLFQVVAVDNEVPPAVQAAWLGAPRPNPTRGGVEVSLELDRAGPARLRVLDVLGREVASLLDRDLAAGVHSVAVEGARLAPGVYAVVLEARGERHVRHLTVVR